VSFSLLVLNGRPPDAALLGRTISSAPPRGPRPIMLISACWTPRQTCRPPPMERNVPASRRRGRVAHGRRRGSTYPRALALRGNGLRIWIRELHVWAPIVSRFHPGRRPRTTHRCVHTGPSPAVSRSSGTGPVPMAVLHTADDLISAAARCPSPPRRRRIRLRQRKRTPGPRRLCSSRRLCHHKPTSIRNDARTDADRARTFVLRPGPQRRGGAQPPTWIYDISPATTYDDPSVNQRTYTPHPTRGARMALRQPSTTATKRSLLPTAV